MADVEPPRTTVEVLAKWQKSAARLKRLHGIAYLGDSTALPPNWREGPARTISGRINERLESEKPNPPVVTFADEGLGPIDYYFLAPSLARARPAAIVLSVNLASFSPEWLRLSSHPEFASLVGTDRWPEAFGLPLHETGVTTDRLLLYSALEELGLSDAWWRLSRYQARVMEAWQTLQRTLDGPSGPISLYEIFLSSHSSNRPREDLRDQQSLRYGTALSGLDPDSLSVQALHATLRYWRDFQIPVLLVVLPVNIELFDSLEIRDPDSLQRTLEVLTDVSRKEGARILDLHDILPEPYFTDLQGHYSYAEESDGPSKIAERITPVLRKMVRHR